MEGKLGNSSFAIRCCCSGDSNNSKGSSVEGDCDNNSNNDGCSGKEGGRVAGQGRKQVQVLGSSAAMLWAAKAATTATVTRMWLTVTESKSSETMAAA